MTADSPILKAGYLSQKRLALPPVKRYVVLCTPLSLPSVHAIFAAVFHVDAATSIPTTHIPWLGQITAAAVKGTPLLIIMDKARPTATPTFIHFSSITSISDEQALGSACNFALHFDGKPHEIRFSCKSSTDYQEWSWAFAEGMRWMKDRFTGETANMRDSNRSGERPQSGGGSSDSSRGSFIVHQAMQDDEQEIHKIAQEHIYSTSPSRAPYMASASYPTPSFEGYRPSSPSPLRTRSVSPGLRIRTTREPTTPVYDEEQAPPAISRTYVLGQSGNSGSSRRDTASLESAGSGKRHSDLSHGTRDSTGKLSSGPVEETLNTHESIEQQASPISPGATSPVQQSYE
ncbi:hypothetical protein BC832DRAFT_360263 [Gaertneriomyces semiglobifer]|nr:hypothetical protein BC832DRAFT_360263 [Gaertneriomyces semiglobifer]